jgi:hypothetical protein
MTPSAAPRSRATAVSRRGGEHGRNGEGRSGGDVDLLASRILADRRERTGGPPGRSEHADTGWHPGFCRAHQGRRVELWGPLHNAPTRASRNLDHPASVDHLGHGEVLDALATHTLRVHHKALGLKRDRLQDDLAPANRLLAAHPSPRRHHRFPRPAIDQWRNRDPVPPKPGPMCATRVPTPRPTSWPVPASSRHGCCGRLVPGVGARARRHYAARLPAFASQAPTRRGDRDPVWLPTSLKCPLSVPVGGTASGLQLSRGHLAAS